MFFHRFRRFCRVDGADCRLASAFKVILLQNDFERSATKFLIQGFNGQRKIDSSGGLLGFDCCVLDACRRLLQHNRAQSGRDY